MVQKTLQILLIGLWILAGCSAQKPDTSMVPPAKQSILPANELRVLTYNLYLRSPQAFFWNQQKERIAGMGNFMRSYDVILFQEVFGETYRQEMLDILSAEYPYHSAVVGGGFGKQNAGLLMLSRWPIEKEEQITYGKDCAGSDCLATKGATYLKINKSGFPYHIFGTHTQASAEHQKVREAQFAQLQALIERQQIPPQEAVLIGGDLNVNLYADSINQAYSNMLDILQAIHPQASPGPTYPPTFDVEVNPLAKGEKTEYLDYVLYSKHHLPPGTSYNKVRIFKKGELNLSDHYAVEGYFRF